MKRLSLTAGLLVSLAFAASASAHMRITLLAHYQAFHPDTNAYALMTDAAQSYWHRTPSCGDPKQEVAPTPAGSSDAAGWVFTAGPIIYECTIYIAAPLWRTPTAVARDYPFLCRLVAHEYGHLLGFGHTPAPNHLMSAILDDQVPDRPCDRATLWAGNHRFVVKNGSVHATSG